jgi:hypothetical protein
MFVSSFVCVALVAVGAVDAEAPTFPSWGGAPEYQVGVNLTAHDVVKTGVTWPFLYFYSSTVGNAKGTLGVNVSRYDHAQGQRDEVCDAIKKGSDAPCTTIHAIDGYMYVDIEGECCKCGNKIKPVRSDWLQDGGAKYVGKATVRGLLADEYLKYGASDNHYYSLAGGTNPVRFMEHKNGMLKQWDFDLPSFRAGPIAGAKELFSAPNNCGNTCHSIMCL